MNRESRHALLIASLLLSSAGCVATARTDASDLFVGKDPTRLEVQCADPWGEPVAGITLELCREPGGTDSQSLRECRVGLCNENGRAIFDDLKSGDYSLTAAESGFARTVVSGFGLGGHQPVAPRVLTITINAVCYDCK